MSVIRDIIDSLKRENVNQKGEDRSKYVCLENGKVHY